MHHSRQPARVVSAGVRARARKHNTSATSISLEEPIVAVEPPVYEPSWRRTGRSSMAADVRIPSFLIPCSAGQLMDARYKSRKFSRATAADITAISPAA
ncbi:hypothetical protein PHMEG_00024442 [Phytophthora megakarya]|uniref:Uncharacterized protein n=1 Tax=Phytophthora megakarya TaxID=4795 RepID=A0A225VFS0_9STRA|nr:hypothetical protein PHMEG_00024442 [Phytophthora megakarya]